MEREPMRQRSKSSNNVKKQFLKNQKSRVQKRLYRNQAQDLDLMFSHKQVRAKKMDLVTQKKETKDLDDEYTKRHHMEQQILTKEKMTYHIEKDNKIYNMFSEM